MKPLIVCVDDENIVLSSLKQQLKDEFRKDFDVEVFDNSDAALKRIEDLNDKIDIPIVISDQVMPGMKGDELLAQIHSISPKTLSILLTGQANVEDVGKAVNYANLYRYIAKPWDHQDLILTVKEALRSFFQDKQLDEKNRQLFSVNKQLGAVNSELERKVLLFNKFIPNQFLKILNLDKDKDHIQLGEFSSCNLTIMFIDIRCFTTYCEFLPPDKILEFINHYAAIAGFCIQQHQGFVDKYLGDGIMAIFTEACHAVKAAIELSRSELTFDVKDEDNKIINYSTGIGINTGDVIIGTVGDPGHISTTVMGDTVNLASRVEDLTRVYDVPLIITGSTFKKIKHDMCDLHLRNIENILIRGRRSPVDIYEVLEAHPPLVQQQKIESIEFFKKARHFYLEHNYENAKRLFEKCLEICPTDTVVKIYLNRINKAA